MLMLRGMDTPSNVILELVSIAEYSSPDWKSTVNIIDNLMDGRGYTIGLVGFCTGTGDFLEVLKFLQTFSPLHLLVTFIPIIEGILASGNPSSVVGLEKLPSVMRRVGKNDKNFLKACWYVIKKLYWKPTLVFCDKFGLKTELARYIVYDTILNFGNLVDFDSMIVEHEEKVFLKKFLVLKQKVIENDETLGDTDNNRVEMQRRLLARENFGLVKPMTVYCYQEKFFLGS